MEWSVRDEMGEDITCRAPSSVIATLSGLPCPFLYNCYSVRTDRLIANTTNS